MGSKGVIVAGSNEAHQMGIIAEPLVSTFGTSSIDLNPT